MNDCIFCGIIEGQIPSAKVYEDENVLAFLTIEAINEGHTLVIPKVHAETFYDLDDTELQKVIKIVKKIAISLDATYSPKKVGLLAQGFEVAHAHIHVVPLNDPGDLTSKKLLEGTAVHPSRKEMDEQAARIRANLSTTK